VVTHTHIHTRRCFELIGHPHLLEEHRGPMWARILRWHYFEHPRRSVENHLEALEVFGEEAHFHVVQIDLFYVREQQEGSYKYVYF
jgi:hypothetical protein